MATHHTPLEPEDVLDLPLPDGVSGYELVDGRPEPVTPASWQHGALIALVCARLHDHLKEHDQPGHIVSDAGFVLNLARDRKRLRGPDVAFSTDETFRKHGNPGERFARFVPDLAIEIDIASGRKPGGMQRVRDYLDAGVRLVWSVKPRTRSATVYRHDGSSTELTEQDALDGEDILPGFTLPLGELFGQTPR